MSQLKSGYTHKLNDKRIENGWAMFDWANSSYALVITAAIFPIYFNAVIDDEFMFLGMKMLDSALFSYTISFAYFITMLALPVLSGIADYGGKRMFFMKIFTTLGSIACLTLFFFKGMSTLYLGLICFVLAIIGFEMGKVFYNSFLPIIVSKDQLDRVSAKGFSYGYVGSVILLIFNLIVIQKPEWFGISDKGLATRLAFITVGLWWIGFAQVAFNRLPKDPKNAPTENLVSKGFEELKKVFGQVKQFPNIKRFLLAFLFYMAGSQTVIMLASTFASGELKFEASELIVIILILQLVGILGAFLFSKLSGVKGNIFTLIVILTIWIGICVSGYLVQSKSMFYVIAAFVGLVMGGIQSMSRSTYSKLIPEDTTDTTSYFSFYDVLEKAAIVGGTFSFGFVNLISGGMRNSILLLALYFVIGLIILWGVKMSVNRLNPEKISSSNT